MGDGFTGQGRLHPGLNELRAAWAQAEILRAALALKG